MYVFVFWFKILFAKEESVIGGRMKGSECGRSSQTTEPAPHDALLRSYNFSSSSRCICRVVVLIFALLRSSNFSSSSICICQVFVFVFALLRSYNFSIRSRCICRVFIGPESDHWECLSLTDSLTDWLTNWLLFSKLDWCDPGVWRCQLKTCDYNFLVSWIR